MRSPYAVEESWAAKWRRRAITNPVLFLAAALWLALAPAHLLVALVVDLVRRKRFATVRFDLFAGWYLGCSIVWQTGILLSWIVSGTWLGASWDRIERHAFWLQLTWATALYRGGEAIFGVRTEIHEVDFPREERGPFLIFMRHTSLADTVLPIATLRWQRGLRLRYVMKRELLWEPLIDVCGQRMPNAFVRRRGSSDPSKEIEEVRKLARNMRPDDGVLIYPEGTRFSAKKHAERLADIQSRDADRYARVKGIRRLLPIRMGGPLALLDEAPDADVLLIAHTGFEAVASFERMINGALVGKTIRVQVRHVPRALIPKDPEAQAAWLDAEWARMDLWVCGVLEERGELIEAASSPPERGEAPRAEQRPAASV